MTSMTITCITSVSAIDMERKVNKQTDEKKYDFTTKCIVVATIFEESVSGVIPVAVDKMNKMTECGSPRLEVNGFVLQQ